MVRLLLLSPHNPEHLEYGLEEDERVKYLERHLLRIAEVLGNAKNDLKHHVGAKEAQRRLRCRHLTIGNE